MPITCASRGLGTQGAATRSSDGWTRATCAEDHGSARTDRWHAQRTRGEEARRGREQARARASDTGERVNV
eukprot:1125792-Pleurochrysis_carterae.AAC.1